MPPLLEVDRVVKRFGGIVALGGVRFAIRQQGIVALIGPNGAGKTTLFDIICGRQAADAGGVRFDGRRIDGMQPYRLSRLGFARSFQECRILPEETCLDNLTFAAQDKRLGRALLGILRPPARPSDQARALLTMAGLDRFAHTVAGALSFGQRRLLEIASALMARPRVLLLDEPASGVNPTMLAALAEMLRAAAASVDLVLLIEHNMALVMSLAGRVVVMHQGSVLADGTPAEVQADARVIDAYLG